MDDSEYMVSRRLIVIFDCGCLAVTTPALSVEKHFNDYCYVVDSEAETVEAFSSLKSDYGPQKMEMMEEGVAFI